MNILIDVPTKRAGETAMISRVLSAGAACLRRFSQDARRRPVPVTAPVPADARPAAGPVRRAAVLLTVLAVLAGLATPAAAQTTTTTYVSNTGQGNTAQTSSRSLYAQNFTTGPTEGGYLLSSVEFVRNVGISGTPALSASVCSVDEDAEPIALCTALNPPGSFAETSFSFTAPVGTVLVRNTTYALRIESNSGNFTIGLTRSDGEDTGAEAGWSIADGHLFQHTNGSWDDNGRSMRVAIKRIIPAPTAADNTVATREDTAHVFAASDFNFSGTGTGDTLAGVTVETLPANGSLTLSGAELSANDAVTRAQLDNGDLKYSPPADANGDGYASFTFKVRNSNSDLLSDDAYTMTIDVTAVDDPATGMPAILGVAVVDMTLTAETGDIADSDGLPATFPDDYTFQWVRVDADGTSNATDINDATSGIYTLTSDDVGKRVKVRVSFTDEAGNLESRDSDPTAVVTATSANDPTAPTVVSILRQSPAFSPTHADSLIWRVRFSEAVQNVDAADFAVSDTTAAPTVAAVSGSSAQYDVTVSGGNLGSLNVTVTLSFVSGQDIADTAGNALENTAPTWKNDNTFDLDNTAPTLTTGRVKGASLVLTFSEALDADSIPSADAFVVNADGSSAPLANTGAVPLDGSVVTLTLASPVRRSAVVTLTYTPPTSSGATPLRDAAGNGVALIDGRTIPNSTPHSPPANLTAKVGEQTVRLVWEKPESEDAPDVGYEFRHAAGASVPTGTNWTRTNDTDVKTVQALQLANGMSYTFEVRAVDSDGRGAPARVTATPAAPVCSAPDLGTRREVWSGTVNVGSVYWETKGDYGLSYTSSGLGPNALGEGFGSLASSSSSFSIDGSANEVLGIFTDLWYDGGGNGLFLRVRRSLSERVYQALQLHWCDQSTEVSYLNASGQYINYSYQATDQRGADFSLYGTLEVALSLPNRDATGAPQISGTAVVGQTLTAAIGDIDDADVLPATFPDDYTFQWVRLDADGTSNPTDITGATTNTYTLTAQDAGKKVRVRVGFTDQLGREEARESEATAEVEASSGSDTTAPVFQSATVDGATLTLTYNEALGGNSVPAVSAFTVMVAGVERELASSSPVAIDGSTVTLTLMTAVSADQTVTVRYTAPTGTGANPLQDASGNAVASDTAVRMVTIKALTVANAIPDQAATAGTAFSYSFPANTFSAADTSDTLSYTATQSDGANLPTWLTFTPATRAFIGTPQAADVGTVTVKVTASDGKGGTVSDSFDIVVDNPLPAGLRAEAGDGRVRLAWTEPTQPIGHEYRYAAGASVPVDTAWTALNNIYQSTVLISGLANGTAYAFEVRAVNSASVVAAVSATPAVAVCSSPDLGARREVWSATLTVGRTLFTSGSAHAGYDHRPSNTEYGSLSPGASFLIGGTSYTIAGLETVIRSGDRRNLFLELVGSRTFPEAVRAALRLHWCSDSSGFVHSPPRYRAIDSNSADWSIYTTRELALSLPENNAATGTPVVAGTAQAGETLTAGMGDIADSDGLPATFPGDYTFQWVRVDADGTSNATDIADATANTYTLTADDIGKRVKVRVSFFDGLGGAEARLGIPTDEVVSAINTVPMVANAIPDQTVTAGTVFSYSFPANTFSDADNDTLSYEATKGDDMELPSWLSFAADTQTFSGTPAFANVGTVTVKVTASDGRGGTVSHEFNIVVSAGTVLAVTSIVRQAPATSPTNADQVTWRVTFNEAVKNVDAADFTVTGTTESPTVSEVTASTVYDVTVSGGNLASLTAMVTLAFAEGQNITDTAGNALTNTAPSGTNDNSYVVDNTAPTVTITDVPAISAAAFTAEFTFSESVTGFAQADIALGNGTASSFTGSTGDTQYTAVITPTATGTVTLDVAANAATDLAGNNNTAAAQAMSNYDPNHGICGRTEQVRTAILGRISGVSNCVDVTATHLANISGTLNLNRVNITALAAGDFAGLTALMNLNLGGNSLTALPDSVFDELTALTTLNLSFNSLTTLTDSVFDELTALTTLNLADNSLTALPNGVFDGLTALTTLNLRSNSLTTLPDTVFDQLIALTTLLLNSNSLTTLRDGVFDRLTALTTLNLNENSLTTLRDGVFDGLTALTVLALTSNDLAELPDDVFEPLTSLNILGLSGNPGVPFSPTAVALPDDGTVPPAGGTVMLDGSGSGGAWGTNVTYAWALTTPATGVTVTFDDHETTSPTVTIPPVTAGTDLVFTLTVTGRGRIGAINGTSTATDTAAVMVRDTVAPTVTSIERQSPTLSPTNADSLTWHVTFSKDVANVDAADFEVTDTTAALAVATVTASTVYSVTASGGNLASLDGTVTLAFASNQNIAVTGGSALANTTPTGTNDNSYVVDNTAPTAPTYTAPSSLQVGEAITVMSPVGASGVNEYAASGLPAGLSINTGTGVISGTPTAAATATASVTVTVSESAGNSVTVSIAFPAVAKGAQTLSGFAYSASSVVFGSTAPTLTAPSGARGALGYAASPSAVCTVDDASGALTIVGVGSCEVTVTAAATANYDEASVSYTIVVQAAGTLVLSVDAITGDDVVNIAEKAAGFAITGGTGSEGGVSVTVTIGSTTLTATSSATSGTATWSVSVPLGASYIAGQSVTVSVSASKTGFTSPDAVARTLTVDLVAPTAPTYTAPSSLQVGEAITVMSPSGGSGIDEYAATGLPSGLSIDSASGAINGTPDTASAGTASATVTASDSAGNSVTVSIAFPAVAKGAQTLSGFAYSASSVVFGSTAPTVTAPSGAQGALSYAASPSAVCTVDDASGALTIVGVGSCEVTVTAAATANYDEASVSYTIVVQAAGTLVLSVDAITGDDVVNIAEKAAGFAITGGTGSEGGVSVTVTIGSTTLTATSSATSGTATWSVSVPLGASYIAGQSVTVSVSASKTGFTSPDAVARTLTVDLVAPTAPTYTAPSSLQVGEAITVMSPSGGSGIDEYAATGLPSGLSIDSASGAINGTPDTASAGTASATVTASDSAGNSVTVSIAFPAVAKGAQTLSGFAYSASSVVFGSTAPTVTAPSGAQGALSYAASPSAVCTVDDASGALTIVGVGSCEVTVTAAATANYDEASVSYTIVVQAAGTLVLSVDAITGDDVVNIAEKAAGFAITGGTGSEGGVSVTVTIGSTTLTATSSATSGTATWSVSVPLGASYIAGQSVTVSVSASKTGFTSPDAVARTLTVDLVAPTAPTYTAPSSLQVGEAITVMSPSGGSGIDEYAATGLPSGLSIDSASGAINGTPDTASAGTASATVTASDSAGNSVTVSIAFPAVAKGAQTLSGFAYSASSVVFGSTAPTVTAPSGAQGALSYAASPSAVCTVDDASGALTIVGVGSCEVTVTAAATANYDEASVSYTIVVQAAGTLVLNVGAISGDNTVNIAEKAEGFAISGDTGTEAGVAVAVEVGTATFSTTSADESGTATWSTCRRMRPTSPVRA